MEHERDAYGGLMVSAFNSRLSGPGSFPGWGHLCCVLRPDLLLPWFLSPPRCINRHWQM